MRLSLLFAALLAALGVGWTFVWNYGADKAEHLMLSFIEREKARGHILNCPKIDKGGFPLRLVLKCPEFSYQDNNGVSLQLPMLRATAQVWNPTHVIAEADGPMVIDKTLKADWALGQMSAKLTLDGFFSEASLHFDDLKLSDLAGPLLLEAKTLSLHARPNDKAANDLDVIGKADAFVLHGPKPVGPANVEVQTVLNGLIAQGQRRALRPFPDWVKNGASVNLVLLRVLNEPSLVTANGTIQLLPSGRPDGVLNVNITELEAFLEKIGLKGQITPMMLTGLQLFGKPVSVEGRQGRAYALQMKNGMVGAGPLQLPVPKLW